MAHISLTDVHVRYPVYSSGRQRSLLGFAANRASFGRIAREAGKIPHVNAINGLTLDLKEGDRVALIGRNGSGKTTLLKVCAGLMYPDAGKIDVKGSRASILNAGGGLDVEKTGLENIELIGRLHGVPRSRRKALIEDIADFTELGDFLALPVRTYSSGMGIRLAFALATSVERDIVVVDEVIGAGDALFLEKAARRVRSMFERAKILILATHSGAIAEQMCNRSVWIGGGKVMADGEPQTTWQAYLSHLHPHEVGAAA